MLIRVITSTDKIRIPLLHIINSIKESLRKVKKLGETSIVIGSIHQNILGLK